jgi:cytochrome c556
MRIVAFAVTTVGFLLSACGGPEASQANNSQANIGNDASPPPATNALILLAAPKQKLLAVMHERHEGMETIGKNFKVLHRQLEGNSPDMPAVRTSAATIAGLSQKASHWFPNGTGPELGKTGAKPEIWQSPQDFTAKLGAFQHAARAFNATARGNDMSAIKARFADLGGACKACHDKYRAEMKH